MSQATPAAAAAAAPPEKKGKGKLPMILAAALVVGGGGSAAFFMLRPPAAAAATEGGESHAAAAKKTEANGIVNFEPFVVNLADAGGRRFLRINVRLLVPALEEAEHIQKSEVLLMRLRSEILDLLTAQTSDQVVAPEGKAALKSAIVERARHIVEPTEVTDVLFSDFVVQY